MQDATALILFQFHDHGIKLELLEQQHLMQVTAPPSSSSSLTCLVTPTQAQTLGLGYLGDWLAPLSPSSIYLRANPIQSNPFIYFPSYF
jgi:hypothetical protein